MSTHKVIGFIGLGNIGFPIAERILQAGFELFLWNRTPGKMDALCAAGAKPAESATDLASKTDMVFICVDSATAVEEIIFGEQGLLGTDRRAQLIVDLSTISPTDEQSFGQRLKDHDTIALLDSPVSGGVVGARAGTLTAMVGGDKKLLDAASAVIATFADQVTHMGSLGAGQATKACNQILNVAAIVAVAEAISLGRQLGIDTNKFPEAIYGGFGDSLVAREYKRSLEAGDASAIRLLIEQLVKFYSGDTRSPPNDLLANEMLPNLVALVLKDLDITMAIGRNGGSPMPLTANLENIFRSLQRLLRQTGK